LEQFAKIAIWGTLKGEQKKRNKKN